MDHNETYHEHDISAERSLLEDVADPEERGPEVELRQERNRQDQEAQEELP